jgi:hypothetical protein
MLQVSGFADMLNGLQLASQAAVARASFPSLPVESVGQFLLLDPSAGRRITHGQSLINKFVFSICCNLNLMSILDKAAQGCARG